MTEEMINLCTTCASSTTWKKTCSNPKCTHYNQTTETVQVSPKNLSAYLKQIQEEMNKDEQQPVQHIVVKGW